MFLLHMLDRSFPNLRSRNAGQLQKAGGTKATELTANPEWKKILTRILNENIDEKGLDALNFQVATLPLLQNSMTFRSPVALPTPGVRTCVFRYFVGEPRTPDERVFINQRAKSDLIAFYSHIEAEKIQSIVQDIPNGSNAVEIVWWMSHTADQFRIAGRAWPLVPTNHKYNSLFPAERLANEHIFFKNTDTSANNEAESKFDWESERFRLWTKHRPEIRGTFMRPVSRKVFSEDMKAFKLPETEDECTTDEQKRLFRRAYENFCIVVIEPFFFEKINVKST